MKQFAAAIALGTLFFPAVARAQASTRSADARLRREYFLGDTSRVAEDAKPLLKKYANDLEIHGWYVVAKGYGDELPGIVDQMKQAAPNSPWTLLASAAASTGWADFEAKQDLCEKAIAGAKDNPDVLVLATAILRQAALYQSRFQHPPNADGLRAFLAKYQAEYKRSANGLAAEAQALDTVAQIEKNTKPTAALKMADAALKSDPTSVAALLLKSQIFLKQRAFQANYDLLKTGAQAVPDSYALHLAYWQAVLALPDAKPAEQRQEVEADAARIAAAVRPSSEFAASNLRPLDTGLPGVGAAIGDMLLQRYPDTAVEDGVLLGQALANDSETNQGRDAQIAALETFLDRRQHYDAHLVSLANYDLAYDISNQENPDLNRLYQAELALAPGKASEYPLVAAGVTMLANHKLHLPELESLARAQLDAEWTNVQRVVMEIPASQAKNVLPQMLGNTAGSWLDTLGWVELQEGKLDAALPELEEAAKLSPEDPNVAVHLGTAYQANGENAKAEATFRNALAMPFLGEGADPALAALRGLYIHTHGSAHGVEAYMQPIFVRDEARRRAMILAARMNPEAPLKPFELASLDGTEVASNGLRGKYLILNFWATW